MCMNMYMHTLIYFNNSVLIEHLFCAKHFSKCLKMAGNKTCKFLALLERQTINTCSSKYIQYISNSDKC
jgi:hypothetical protein